MFSFTRNFSFSFHRMFVCVTLVDFLAFMDIPLPFYPVSSSAFDCVCVCVCICAADTKKTDSRKMFARTFRFKNMKKMN